MKEIIRDLLFVIFNHVNERTARSMQITSIEIEGKKISIYLGRPGLLIGKGGETINKITEKFKEEYPEMEIEIIENTFLFGLNSMISLYYN